MRQPRRGPRPIGEAISRIRSAAMPRTLLAAVQEAWPEAVGDRIATEAQPTAEREGTITVSCRSATWAEELGLLHDELLARLNDALRARAGTESPDATGVANGLRFTAAGVP